MQLIVDISHFYSGVVQTGAHGMNQRFCVQLKMGISLFYSGVAPMDVHGMHQLVQMQL
jgi:hypothetical protein